MTEDGRHQAQVVRSPELGTKALHYLGHHADPAKRFLSFVAERVDPGRTAGFEGRWTGVVRALPKGAPLDIWLGSPHYGALGGLRFEGGQVLVSYGPQAGDWRAVGELEAGQRHVVFMRVDKQSRSFSATVLSAAGTLTVDPQPILSRDYLGTDRPSLHFHYAQPVEVGGYVMTEVTIRKR